MKDVVRSGFASRMSLVVICAYAILATALLTNFDFNLFGIERYGLVFNDMAQRLLHLDWTISPGIISGEGFFINGRAYTYWGVLPAILRMPLIPFGLGEVVVARVSCIAAVTIFVWSILRLAMVTVTSRASNQAPLLLSIWAAAFILSGPPVYLLNCAWAYNEPIFWAAAFTAVFNYVALAAYFRDRWPERWSLVCLAILAGLALLTRVPNGVALLVATVLLAAVPTWRWYNYRSGDIRWVGATALAILLFVALTGIVNAGRWGNPLIFAPFEKQEFIAGTPRALKVVTEQGTFSPVRIPMSVLYLATGLPIKAPFENFLDSHYSAVEGPRIPLVLVSPLPLMFACWGIVAFFRIPRSRMAIPAIVIFSQIVGAALVLGTPFLAWRYTFDFWGIICAAGALGLSDLLLKERSRWTFTFMFLLLTIGIFASAASLVRYKISSNGVPSDLRFAWSRTIQPWICPRATLTGSVASKPPLVTPSCPPMW